MESTRLEFMARRICEGFDQEKEGDILFFAHQAVLRENRERGGNVEAKTEEKGEVASRRVGRRRLKLIGNVIVSRESFAAVLHL